MKKQLPLPSFQDVRVLIVGDLMLDCYWDGEVRRISPEAPVPVVEVREKSSRPGGAANVANNVAALGAQVTLRGAVGRDGAGEELLAALRAAGVECRVNELAGRVTTVKTRVISRRQQLLRMDFEEAAPIPEAAAPAQEIEALVAASHAVALSDYAKGALAEPQPWIAAARRLGKPVLVDPKGRDFTRYRGATLLTPNIGEFENVSGPCASESRLVERGAQMVAELDLQHLLVTRGEHGMSLISRDGPPVHIRAKAHEVFDVTGAGDTVLATTAVGLACGLAAADAARLANRAAGVVVGRFGSAALSRAELESALG